MQREHGRLRSHLRLAWWQDQQDWAGLGEQDAHTWERKGLTGAVAASFAVVEVVVKVGEGDVDDLVLCLCCGRAKVEVHVVGEHVRVGRVEHLERRLTLSLSRSGDRLLFNPVPYCVIFALFIHFLLDFQLLFPAYTRPSHIG
jgi:hypothetical protein